MRDIVSPSFVANRQPQAECQRQDDELTAFLRVLGTSIFIAFVVAVGSTVLASHVLAICVGIALESTTVDIVPTTGLGAVRA